MGWERWSGHGIQVGRAYKIGAEGKARDTRSIGTLAFLCWRFVLGFCVGVLCWRFICLGVLVYWHIGVLVYWHSGVVRWLMSVFLCSCAGWPGLAPRPARAVRFCASHCPGSPQNRDKARPHKVRARIRGRTYGPSGHLHAHRGHQP